MIEWLFLVKRNYQKVSFRFVNVVFFIILYNNKHAVGSG